MNIIARAALYLYDGSNAAPIFPGKVGKPGDEAAAYLSTVADKLMASDGSRTTCVEPGSAQEEMLRRFVLTPFQEAADALMRSMDETMQTLEIPREGFDMAIFSFEKDGNPHLCVAQLPIAARWCISSTSPRTARRARRLSPMARCSLCRAAKAVRVLWSICPRATSVCGTRRC